MAFAEDLSPFFADFGEEGTLAGAAVRGIFEQAPADTQMGDLGVSAMQPVFELPSAQVPANAFGAALVLPRGSFTVREHQPDGTGLSRLLLTLA